MRLQKFTALIKQSLSGLILIATTATTLAAPTADIDGAKDLTLIKRYPGSYIIGSQTEEFTDFIFPKTTNTRDKAAVFASETVQGENTTLVYEVPQETTTSTVKVFKSFESSLQKAGFTTEISCSGAKRECGYFFYREFVNSPIRQSHYGKFKDWINLTDGDFYLYTGSIKKGDEQYYVILSVSKAWKTVQYTIDVLRKTTLQTEDIAISLETPPVTVGATPVTKLSLSTS